MQLNRTTFLDSPNAERIESVRSTSRRLVRELGFMGDALAGTDLAPSAVHALIEIGQKADITASDLSDLLLLEKSSVSRMLKRLIGKGLLTVARSGEDARSKRLALSDRGQVLLAVIHARAREQVERALGGLSATAQRVVVDGLTAYADALAGCRIGAPLGAIRPVETRFGHAPGAIGRIVEMHASYYAAHWDFGAFFEAKVAQGLAEFAGRLGRPSNGLWLGLLNGRIVGSVAIDGEDLGRNEAHLRWFVVDAEAQGLGLGRRLLRQALDFCDRQGFDGVRLWTFKGLDAARKLYEDSGFVLAESFAGDQWGKEVTEQIFFRKAGGRG